MVPEAGPDREMSASIPPDMRRLLCLLPLLLGITLVGCDDDDGGDVDAGPLPPGVDAGDGDAGPPFDAGPGTDAGDIDAGPPPVDPCMGSGPPALDVETVGSFTRPVLVTYAPGDDGAIYIVEQPGRVQRVAPGGAVNEFVSINVENGDSGGNEQGLLGLAFHPDYASNGRFFMYFVERGTGNNTLREYARDGSDPTRGLPAEVATLVDEADFAGNHNGGMIAFGPDGFLYAGLGDGGGANDPQRHGLNTNSLFGSILRLDVDNAPNYEAAGNPFIGGGGAPQIWAYGLRNPYRFSFDQATGDLWIGDVGQNEWEEIDYQPAGAAGGTNYGWRAYEGTREFSRAEASDLAAATNHTPPIYEYAHGPGCSVAGGFVYRGTSIPGLQGWYLFADLCSSEVSALRQCPGGVEVESVLGPMDTGFTGLFSLGQDEDGEVYLCSGGGQVVRITAE